MPLKVALQMDPIGSVNINADSTFRIALEAQARGHHLFFYTPDRLAFVEGRVLARGWPIEVRREIGNHVKVYQGVTLGALSFPTDASGNLIRDSKRHPTIEDRVVIYANATILGGETVIGQNSIIRLVPWGDCRRLS